MSDVIDQLSWLSNLTTFTQLLLFVYSLVLMLRFFKSFSGQPRMAIIGKTLVMAAEDLYHFIVLYGIIIANFTITGYILFGAQLSDWASLGSALNRTIRAVYDFRSRELELVAPILAPFWFWTYFLVVVLLVISTLTAVILDRYVEARAGLSSSCPGLFSQAWKMCLVGLKKRDYDSTAPSYEILSDALEPVSGAKQQRDNGFTFGGELEDLGTLNAKPPDTEAKANMAEVDPDFLVARGIARRDAEAILEHCIRERRQVHMNRPLEMLRTTVEVRMGNIYRRVAKLRSECETQLDCTADAFDRASIKHSKSMAMVARICRAQTVPTGWKEMRDQDGALYYIHEETGKDALTLPRGVHEDPEEERRQRAIRRAQKAEAQKALAAPPKEDTPALTR